MPKETYVQARTRLLTALAARGWTTKPMLKVPQAAPPSGGYRPAFVIFFTPQAVRMNDHSMFLDIRIVSIDCFLADVERTCRVRGIDWKREV